MSSTGSRGFGGAATTRFWATGRGTFSSGGAGQDWLEGRAGDDSLQGGDGHDRLLGGEGADLLEGGSGNDRLEGGTGDDTILGGDGNDLLFGGDGADLIDGGTGYDMALYADATEALVLDLDAQGANAGAAAGDLLGGNRRSGVPASPTG